MQDRADYTVSRNIANEKPEDVSTEEAHTFSGFFKKIVGLWAKILLSIGLCFYAIQLVTWLPDIDHWFIGVLHHRSIITHSIFLPAITWIVLQRDKSIIASILFMAVGIHLSADVLSPSQGYGAIWLPEPLKLNLGEFSKAWLVSNAVIAFSFGTKSCPMRYRHSMMAGAFFSSIFYAFVNEESVLAAVLTVTFLTIGFWIESRFSPSPDSPIQITRQLLSQRARTRQFERQERARMKTQRGRFYLVKGILGLPYQIFNVMRFMLFWSFKKPRMAVSIAALAMITFLSFYLVGSSRSNSVSGAVTSGAAETLSNGVWVLHSSGGWILRQGGKYVAGTLTPTKP